MRHSVIVSGEECYVSIAQSSKALWVASGMIEGKRLSVESGSASAALRHWVAAARERRAQDRP